MQEYNIIWENNQFDQILHNNITHIMICNILFVIHMNY